MIVVKSTVLKMGFVQSLVLGAFFAGAHAWAQSDPAATTRAAVLAIIDSKTDQEVYDLLKTSGIGACWVFEDVNDLYNCKNYLISTIHTHSLNGVTYSGMPITQNESTSRSSAYHATNRMSQYSSSGAGGPFASTGCFGGSGGFDNMSYSCFQGNTSDECGTSAAPLSKQAYAKLVARRMVENVVTDPCRISVLHQTITTLNTQSATTMLTTQKVFLDSSQNCRILISAGNYSPAIPKNFCDFFKARARFLSNASLASLPSGAVTIPFPGTAGYSAYQVQQANNIITLANPMLNVPTQSQ